jgi:signal transduction histidine kinase
MIRAVGHNIRNKLGVMKNSIYYLDMKLGRGDPKVQKHLRIMGREIASANRMVADLMDFALSKEPARRQVDIKEIVTKALSEASLPDRWETAVSLDDDLPPVMADAVQLQRAFTNIILRIAEGAPKGGKLQIAASEQDSQVEISLGSASLLIPEENLAMAATPLASTGGSGLGMAVSKMLVEGHGGTVEISRLGRDGAMFVVRLPL